MTTRSTPPRASRSITCSRNGRPATGTIPFGSPAAAAPSRVPRPPARIATGGSAVRHARQVEERSRAGAGVSSSSAIGRSKPSRASTTKSGRRLTSS